MKFCRNMANPNCNWRSQRFLSDIEAGVAAPNILVLVEIRNACVEGRTNGSRSLKPIGPIGHLGRRQIFDELI